MKRLGLARVGLAARHLACWCLLICVAVAATVHASAPSAGTGETAAQPAFLQLSQLRRTLFTVRDGLPSTIYAITEDKGGYLWLGGPTGLFRFDGLNVVPMLKGQLPPEVITALYGDRDGNLWVGGLHGTITRVHDGIAERVDRGLNGGTVMSFKQMADGTLWMVTATRVYRLVDGAWRPVGAAEGIDATSVWVTGTGADGSYWIFTASGAYRLRPGAQRFEHDTANNAITAMANLPAAAVYPSDGVAADLIVDRAGALWIPTSGKLVRLHADNSSGQPQLVTENIAASDQHSAIHVTADFSDNQGNVWIATPEGLEQFRATRFVPLVLPLPVFWPAMIEDSEHALWVVSTSGAPPLRVGDTVTVHPELDGSAPCMASGPDGSVWSSGYKGIGHYLHGSASEVPAPPIPGQKGLPADPKPYCQDIQLAGDGSLWVSTRSSGLTRWDGHAWTTIDPRAPMSFQFEGTRTWLAFNTGKLKSIDQGKTTVYPAPSGLDLGALTKLRQGSSGLWIAGDGGIVVKTGAHFHRLAGTHGERFENATDVIQLSNGDVWIASPRGLYRVAGAEIRSALAAADHAVAYTLFDQTDGVENPRNLLVSDKGRLWVSLRGGVASIDALHMPPIPAAPRVSIESLNDHDVRFSGASTPVLERGTRSVTIAYAAPTLSTPSESHFRYLLKGIDDDWQVASDRREAHYANLGAGDYLFQVEASNADGNWAGQPTVLAFQILPEFYQTWWFRILCVALAIAALWLLYLMHVRHIYAQLDARVRERERMARDFHDTILQNFQSLLLHVELAARSVTEETARRKLDKAIVATENALNEGRDKIGELRSLAEPLEDLPTGIAHLANRLGDMYPTAFSMQVEGKPRPLNATAASDIHAIVGELVTNAFRHSGANNLRVELRYGRRELSITIVDDGRGMESSVVERGKPGHWGLQGIRERARRIGGRFAIGTAASGKGTRANLRISARFVYAGRQWLRPHRAR
jgi:signal transduction histidine kinase/ligand-binding sensor domain-containing protein